MQLKIRYKIFLILALTSLTSIFAMALVSQWNTQQNFLAFRAEVESTELPIFIDKLSRYYQKHGNWNQLQGPPRNFLELLRPSTARLPQHIPPDLSGTSRETPPPPGTYALDPSRAGIINEQSEPLPFRLLLLDVNGNKITGRGRRADQKRPIEVDGKIVGWLGLQAAPALELSAVELTFMERERKALYLSISILTALSLLISLWFAGQFERPIQALAKLAHSLTRGTFNARSKINSRDELGALAQDLNTLAATLEKNESLRKQWIADTSHELRTPIAILRGEIEALRDKIRQPTDEVLGSLQEEIDHLTKLVDDLNTLTLADSGALNYQMDTIDLSIVLNDVLENFSNRAEQHGIRLINHAHDHVEVEGDVTRLHQLLTNLIENSLRYTDAPGEVSIQLKQQDYSAIITIEDTPPCPMDAELNQLFDRFYRTESSRNRKSGGSGLGLAICSKIIEAHQGLIEAYPASSGGVGIRITLPLIRR